MTRFAMHSWHACKHGKPASSRIFQCRSVSEGPARFVRKSSVATVRLFRSQSIVYWSILLRCCVTCSTSFAGSVGQVPTRVRARLLEAMALLNDAGAAVTEMLEGLVAAVPHLNRLDGFPEVKLWQFTRYTWLSDGITARKCMRRTWCWYALANGPLRRALA